MKIKKVNIKAFRLFNDVSVNLTARKDSNKAANFVAIYNTSVNFYRKIKS